VPADRIAENLAFVNWTVLTGLAVGAFAVVVLARLRTTATRGYLVFCAACALGFGALALVSDTALPTGLIGSPVVVDPAFDLPRRVLLVAFLVLAMATIVVLARGGPADRIGPLGVAAGIGVWLAAAGGWGDGPVGVAFLFVQLAVLGCATGGVFAAMVLGHWYLVTPKLPEAPLILVARLLLVVVAVQLGLFVVWAAVGAGTDGVPGGGPFSALTGPWALFVWLRLVVGLVFPLIVSWAAVQTERSRSMESATGLLYINVGTIAAGTILAAGLYFGAGLLV
jgi:hypothetical protein